MKIPGWAFRTLHHQVSSNATMAGGKFTRPSINCGNTSGESHRYWLNYRLRNTTRIAEPTLSINWYRAKK